MFGKGLGGIEQAFLDYTEALANLGHEVMCVVRPNAKIIPWVEKLQQEYPGKIIIRKVPHFNKWDLFAKFSLSRILKKYFPDVVICHGNRPSALFRYGTTTHGMAALNPSRAPGRDGIARAMPRSAAAQSPRAFLS